MGTTGWNHIKSLAYQMILMLSKCENERSKRNGAYEWKAAWACAISNVLLGAECGWPPIKCGLHMYENMSSVLNSINVRKRRPSTDDRNSASQVPEYMFVCL